MWNTSYREVPRRRPWWQCDVRDHILIPGRPILSNRQEPRARSKIRKPNSPGFLIFPTDISTHLIFWFCSRHLLFLHADHDLPQKIGKETQGKDDQRDEDASNAEYDSRRDQIKKPNQEGQTTDWKK